MVLLFFRHIIYCLAYILYTIYCMYQDSPPLSRSAPLTAFDVDNRLTCGGQRRIALQVRRSHEPVDVFHYHITPTGQNKGTWNGAYLSFRTIMREPDTINFVTILREPRSHLLRCGSSCPSLDPCGTFLTPDRCFCHLRELGKSFWGCAVPSERDVPEVVCHVGSIHL